MRLSILPRPRFPRPCTQLLLLSHASGCAAALMMLPSCQPLSPIVPPEPLGLLLMGNLPQCIAALICHLHCQDDNYRCSQCTWIIVLHCLQTEQCPTFAAKIACGSEGSLAHTSNTKHLTTTSRMSDVAICPFPADPFSKHTHAAMHLAVF